MCVRVATDKHTLCILPFKWLSSALAVASAVGILHNSDIATARAPKKGTRAVLLPPMGAAGRCCVRVALLS